MTTHKNLSIAAAAAAEVCLCVFPKKLQTAVLECQKKIVVNACSSCLFFS
jgi:hypothetical protein